MKLTGILPMLRLEIGSSTDVNTALVICDACCTHSWIPENLAQRLKLTGHKIDNRVNCSKLTELISTQKVELNVFAKLDHHEQSLRVTQFFKESLSVDSKTIDIPILKDRFQHLELIKPFVYNYFDLQMKLYGRMLSHVIKHLEYFKEEIKILLSLSISPLVGFSVVRFIHQMVLESPPSSALLKTYHLPTN